MAAQSWRVPLASPLAPALRTGAAAAKPLSWSPHSAHLDGLLCPSSWGAWVPFPLFFWVSWDSAMAAAITGAARLFVASRGNFTNILDYNGGPCPVTPGKVPSTAVAPETFGVMV